MWIIFTQWAQAYGDLHLLFVRESEYFIEFPYNCWFFLIQIIIFTFRKIRRFQWGSFLWARLICVLAAYWANDWPTRSIFSGLVLRERMDRTATGIYHSYGIPQVLLKVTYKFKNANLFSVERHSWTLSSNNTCPAVLTWNRLRYKIQQRSKLLARMGVAVFYWRKYIIFSTMTETVSAMEEGKIPV